MAAVDGEIYIVEVKSSFAGVNETLLDQLEQLAQKLRPDVVMLAVMADAAELGASDEMIKKRCDLLKKFDVRFELSTKTSKDRSASAEEIALQTGEEMKWSAR